MVPVKRSKQRRGHQQPGERVAAGGLVRRAASHGIVACATVVLWACASHAAAGTGTTGPTPERNGLAQRVVDPMRAYRDAGLLVQDGPLPFVGSVHFLRGRSPDSTRVLVALSLASRELTFTGTGTLRRAAYDVTLALVRDGVPVLRDTAHEVVRVASLAETLREDESIVFERMLVAPPGSFVLHVRVRDMGSGTVAEREQPVEVPAFAAGSLTAPIPVYEVTPRTTLDSPPRLIANPRGLLVYGRDSVARWYVEAYGPSDTGAVVVRLIDAHEREVARDTVRLAVHGALASGVVSVPLARLGGGRLTAQAALAGADDTVRTPVLVAVVEALGPMPLGQLASYLRFFAAPARLASLRDTNPDRRAEAWSALLAAADSAEPRGASEALRAYFARIAVADQRYRDEGGPGWLTDRGRVFVTLGEPDRMVERAIPGAEPGRRALAWEYVRYSTQLVFVDRTGFGQWRLTPSSNATFGELESRVRLR